MAPYSSGEIWYDGTNWQEIDARWLYSCGYYIYDNSMYNMQGQPISQSTQAMEANPKYEPPLSEEREI